MTVNQLTYFTVTGYWFDVETPDTSSTTNQPKFSVVSAFVTFTPRLAPGTVEYIQNLDLGQLVPAPANLTVTGSTTGGTLAAGTYDWVVTSTNSNGESTQSSIVTAILTSGTSSAALTWSVAYGAQGYNVYRVQGATTKLVGTTTSTSFTDTGQAGTTATLPVTNTAELSANTALALAPVTARIYEGQLQTINQAGSPGVQLVANTALLDLNLIYDVAFTDIVYAGQAQVLTNFAFQAPTTNTTIDLADPTLARLTYDPTNYT